MKTWKIPVQYCMTGFVFIDANTLSEATDIAVTDPDVFLPDDPSYVDGTFEVVEVGEDYIRSVYNDDMPDCDEGEFDDEDYIRKVYQNEPEDEDKNNDMWQEIESLFE